MLELQLERLDRCKLARQVVVATSDHAGDAPVVALCAGLGIPVFRGSESDVLARYYGAAVHFKADPVIRITADCPLIDPAVTDLVIARFLEGAGGVDYVSNCLERRFPRGLDTEAFSFAALERAFKEAKPGPEREHVTPYLYGEPGRFRLAGVKHGTDESGYRWTVDTPEDFEFVQRVYEALYPKQPEFAWLDVLKLLQQKPELVRINAHVRQKAH